MPDDVLGPVLREGRDEPLPAHAVDLHGCEPASGSEEPAAAALRREAGVEPLQLGRIGRLHRADMNAP